MVAGSVIALAATAQTRDPWKGFAWGAGAGLAKELLDANSSGQCSAKDLAVTVLGAAIGAGLGARIIVTPRSVTYSVDF